MLSGVLFCSFIMERCQARHFNTSCITLGLKILILIPYHHERAKTGLRPSFYLNCSHILALNSQCYINIRMGGFYTGFSLTWQSIHMLGEIVMTNKNLFCKFYESPCTKIHT